MSESLEEKICRFQSFNNGLIETAMMDCNRMDQGVHAKILLCSILDSLSKSAFPAIKENADRFKKAIVKFGAWHDADRASLLHIKRLLEVVGDVPEQFQEPDKFKEFNKWVEDEFNKHFSFSGQLISVNLHLEKDVEFETLKNLWPSSSEGNFYKIGNVLPCKLKHKHLLWLYRNALVHEYRLPGKGAEISRSEDTKPYYQQLSSLTGFHSGGELDFSQRWELVYPTGFFKSLASKVLDGVAAFHRDKGSNPFEAYSDSSYWIPKLSEEC